ncbi:MAG: hypothetical protein SFY69_02745 [Planctomycetota bacterium]|nr:hypothetical protein [Planctomycetota bacterium]
MLIVVSPYHLSTREAPAMAAMLLASTAVTLMPGAMLNGAPDAVQEAARTRAYAELARSWSWTTSLFDAGVLRLGLDDASPLDDLRGVHESIRDDARYAALRAFVRDDDFACERSRLGAISRDILRAGPNPGLSVPVAAALDRFALRAGAFIARSPAASVAQRQEERLARPLGTVALPVLVQATGERVLHAREVLAGALEPLRRLFDSAHARDEQPLDARVLSEAASGYAASFERLRGAVLEDARGDDVRCIESVAVISLVRLPADAALASSVRAMAVLGGGASPDADEPERGPSAPGLVRTPADPTRGRHVIALIVKTLGARG